MYLLKKDQKIRAGVDPPPHSGNNENVFLIDVFPYKLYHRNKKIHFHEITVCYKIQLTFFEEGIAQGGKSYSLGKIVKILGYIWQNFQRFTLLPQSWQINA